ncbi:MAG: glycine-rich domain-containing protein [Opitutaceae bacterium]
MSVEASAADATGGTITRSGNYLIHTFTSSGTFTAPAAMTCDVLLIGGGGGGAQGGGGGGGFYYVTNQSTPSGAHAVTVGAGGVASNNGQNSSFRSFTAYGGGGGGQAGASGGGAPRDADGSGGAANHGSQGYEGGGAEASGWCSSGGGGGAGGSGGPGRNVGGYENDEWQYPDDKGGNGGIGRLCDITGSNVYYAGGGGGTNDSGYGAIPSSGLGGGGIGSRQQGVGGSGANGLGGGGGAHAPGGSGIVIIRYYSVAAPQTITFASIPNKTYGDSPFAVTATASSGLPVTLTVISGPATISGNTVTLTGALGTVTITASQAGNLVYGPATSVSRSFTVKYDQTLNFGSLSDRTFSVTPFAVSASASSGLAPVFSIASGAAAVSGNNVVLLGSGAVTVTASQPGNGTYNPAPDVSQNFNVSKAMTATATGGTIARLGDYLIHTFTGNGTFSLPGGGAVTAEILLIGGGGGGRQGGGGGGGVRNLFGQIINAGSHTVTVGNGGAGGSSATNGGNSSFGAMISHGGGAGGQGGASGGGAERDANGPGGAALYGSEGYPGGRSNDGGWSSAGGGGGAGGPGEDGGNVGGWDEGAQEWQYPDQKGGDGGIGRQAATTGINIYYGGGGGGTNESGEGALPAGGLGGGGAGSRGYATGGAGVNGLGGGGGAYASGGSGVVIVRYFSPLPDTTPPVAPSNLASPSHTATSVNLGWSASTDEFGVVAYDVYRTKGGVTNIVTPPTTSTTFDDTHVLPGTTYTYFVKARDAAGNASAASNTINVTTDAVADVDADDIPDAVEALFGTQSDPAASSEPNLNLQPHRPHL